MSVPQWAWQLAQAFRAAAGMLALYPLDLRNAILWGCEVTVEERPGLTVADLSRRLARAGCVTPRGDDRPLRGCLIARGGAGWIFLDANDPADEKDYSLAHELAHFLRHHWAPRRRAASLGAAALAAFDTGCPADPATRLRAALGAVSICSYSHLMERSPAYTDPQLLVVEEEADLLACELLAPEEEVRRRAVDRATAEAALVETFGLPHAAARAHARRLFPSRRAWPLLGVLNKCYERCRNAEGAAE